jgi:hypothetical protein
MLDNLETQHGPYIHLLEIRLVMSDSSLHINIHFYANAILHDLSRHRSTHTEQSAEEKIWTHVNKVQKILHYCPHY